MSIGRWSIHHPKAAVAAWLAFVASCIALGAVTGTKTLDNGAVGESAWGYALMDDNGLWGPAQELAYIRARHAAIPPAVIGDVERRLRDIGLDTQRTVT